MHVAKFIVSRMLDVMIRARKRAFVVTDRLRHGRATVVKLGDVGNR
jgi:hypothetical protein